VAGFGIGRLGYAGLAAVAALVVLAAAPATASQRVRYSTGQFVINCAPDGTPQICDPPEKLKVRVRHHKVRITRLRYVAATTHCSPGRVLVSLDGDRIGRTDYVNAGERATVDDLRVTLHPGGHKFGFRLQGKTQGCNAGSVVSWGGKIILKGRRLSG
jgi:hypothetical protein